MDGFPLFFSWQLFVLFMLCVRFRDQILVMIHLWRKGIENPMLYLLNTNGLYATPYYTQWTKKCQLLQSDLVWTLATELFRGLSDLHLRNQKVTFKKLVYTVSFIVTFLHPYRERQKRILGFSSPPTATLTCSPPNDEEVLLPFWWVMLLFLEGFLLQAT